MNATLDPRTRRTRELLKDALCQLMKQRNLSSISVREITDLATVNRATFYAHFADKQELLEACVRDWFRERLAAHISLRAPYSSQQLRDLTRALKEFLEAGNSPSCRNLKREIHPLIETTTQEELYAFILAWLPLVLPDIKGQPTSLETVATLLTWAVFGAGKRLADPNNQLTFEEVTDQLILMVTEGIFQRRPSPPYSSPLAVVP